MKNQQIFIPPQNNMEGGDLTGGAKGEGESRTGEEEQMEEQEKVPPVKFSDFKSITSQQAEVEDDGEDELTQQEVDKKKAAKKEEEVKKEEKVKEEEETKSAKVEQQETKREKSTSDERDYADLPENVIPIFKKMSNESFNALKPVYLAHGKLQEEVKKKETEIAELKKGKVSLPESYFEHPQGYLLDPEYTQAEVNTNLSQQILNHWNQQLILIRQGKPWQDLGEDQKGNIIALSPKQPTENDEIAVMNYINFAHQQLVKNQSKMETAAERFKSRHTEDIKLLKEAETTYFPDFDKPEHPTSGIQKQVIEALPASMRKHPLASVLAKTAAANALLRAEILNLKGGVKPPTDTKEDKTVTNGPKKGQVGGGTGKQNNSQPEVKFSTFRNLIER